MNYAIDCHYSIQGKGPALFLIHGIGATKDAWRFLLPDLQKNFTVIKENKKDKVIAKIIKYLNSIE